MKKITYMLAWRFLKGARHETSVSTMAIVSFCAITIGVFSLALVVSVMSGFEKTTHQQLQNIHPQLIVRSGGRTINAEKIQKLFTQEYPEVIAIAPTATQNILLQTTNTPSIDQALVLKAIDPEQETKVTNLEKKIIAPRKPLQQLLVDNFVVIGQKLAHSLGLCIGQEVTIHYAITTKKGKLAFEQEVARIGGTFSTGIEEFDTQLIFCSFDFFKKIFPSAGPTELGLRLSAQANEDRIKKNLRDRTCLDVYSWQDLYPALVSALKLEKYVMFFLLALVTLVACMTITSLLFMHIVNKRGTIAILLALGSSIKTVQQIFYEMGLLLTFFASTTGLVGAYIVGRLLQTYPFIKLPDVYYVSHLPISLDATNFVIIFILSHALSLIALWVAISRIKKISITNVLRFEA
jgi:lipoprotein-releasing system permease protein